MLVLRIGKARAGVTCSIENKESEHVAGRFSMNGPQLQAIRLRERVQQVAPVLGGGDAQ